MNILKNNSEFKELTRLNNGSETLEVEMVINGEKCSVFYFKDDDELILTFWCDWFGDEKKFLKTSNFDSFRDYTETNEQLIYFTDNWDYSSESVYQEYFKYDFEDWLLNEGSEDLEIFVEWQVQQYGLQYVKRSLKNRIERWFEKTLFNIKKIIK